MVSITFYVSITIIFFLNYYFAHLVFLMLPLIYIFILQNACFKTHLIHEIQAGELMKIEYQRKVASLNKQKKRGASPETLEKTKAAVSHLHTRYIVDMQSMDLTVSEINRLRDKQLYPKLVDLVCG